MSETLWTIFNLIGSAFPLSIICLCLAVVICNKTISKKALISFIIVTVLMFFILLRT